MEPASEGASAIDTVRASGLAPSGTVTTVEASPAPTIDPVVPASRWMPKGKTGSGISTASVSTAVFAVAVMVAMPTALAA